MQEAMIRLCNLMECDHCIVSTGCRLNRMQAYITFFRLYKRRFFCNRYIYLIVLNEYDPSTMWLFIENNPIIRTYCKTILNFQIYILYHLNKVWRNIYIYSTYNRKLRVCPRNKKQMIANWWKQSVLIINMYWKV